MPTRKWHFSMFIALIIDCTEYLSRIKLIFFSFCYSQALTLENIIARLKYRYDREIDRAERPVLRKITERDDVPQKTMILCVVNIMVKCVLCVYVHSSLYSYTVHTNNCLMFCLQN